MADGKLKQGLTVHTGEFMAAVLLVQPLLDVLSYFMIQLDATALTTALRLALLAVVSLYGFAVSDHRRAYLAMYGVLGGFWALHALNCFRVGYLDPVGDLAEYLKLVQYPLWTLAFLTFFRKRPGLDRRAIGLAAANLALVLLVICLSFGTGRPVYTYEYPKRGLYIGVLGWFGEANSQSVIVCVLAVFLLLWGLKTGVLWKFSLCCAGGLGVLFFTGTRLTYFTALILAVAFMALALLERRSVFFLLPLGAALVLLICFRGASPMQERQAVTRNSSVLYQEKIDAIMGEDAGFRYDGSPVPEETLQRIRQVYTEIYAKPGLYGEPLLGPLIDAYGVERVMEEFDYSVSAETLHDGRDRRLRAAKMVWDDSDALTHILGYEYAAVTVSGQNYDMENDFPAVFYFYGFFGFALYACFLLWAVIYLAAAFLRRFPGLFTAEFLAMGMALVLVFGAAQLTGHVLRRPNVLVYASLCTALLVYWAERGTRVSRAPTGDDEAGKQNPRIGDLP